MGAKRNRKVGERMTWLPNAKMRKKISSSQSILRRWRGPFVLPQQRASFTWVCDDVAKIGKARVWMQSKLGFVVTVFVVWISV